MPGLPFTGPGTPTDCDLMMELNDTDLGCQQEAPRSFDTTRGVLIFLTA
jgi:hypothetical protein